jgi:hypothetical protein
MDRSTDPIKPVAPVMRTVLPLYVPGIDKTLDFTGLNFSDVDKSGHSFILLKDFLFLHHTHQMQFLCLIDIKCKNAVDRATKQNALIAHLVTILQGREERQRAG